VAIKRLEPFEGCHAATALRSWSPLARQRHGCDLSGAPVGELLMVSDTPNSSTSSRREAIREAQARFHAHPGYREHMRIRAFTVTLVEVFEPNYADLIEILEGVASGSDLAVEMIENITSAQVGAGVASRFNRHLHNYVAGASSLIDHARRMTRDRDDAVTREYEKRKAQVIVNPEIPFIVGLRNLSLHRSLPIIGYTLSMTQTGLERSEVELSVADLLDSDRWNGTMREYISAFGERLPVRPVVTRHHELVLDLNSWLINELQGANRVPLVEANELLVAINAAIMGVDLETARTRTLLEELRRTTIT